MQFTFRFSSPLVMLLKLSRCAGDNDAAKANANATIAATGNMRTLPAREGAQIATARRGMQISFRARLSKGGTF
jgi:hypothetical protein